MDREKLTAKGMKTMQADVSFLINYRDLIRTAVTWVDHRYIEL